MSENVTLRMPKGDWSEIQRNLEKLCGRGRSDIEILQDVTVVEASAFEEIRANREDQLRQLLSWAKDLSTNPLHAMTETSELSGEFANRLAAILDGEG